MKKCSKCGLEKELSEFYKDKRGKDGLYSLCKNCHLKYNKTDKIKKWHKIYHKQLNYKKYQKEYQKEYHKEYNKDNTNNIRKKYLCRQQTRNFIRAGKLIELPCEICGVKKVEAHHEYYNKPLEIVWLCKKHHWEFHNNLK